MPHPVSSSRYRLWLTPPNTLLAPIRPELAATSMSEKESSGWSAPGGAACAERGSSQGSESRPTRRNPLPEPSGESLGGTSAACFLRRSWSAGRGRTPVEGILPRLLPELGLRKLFLVKLREVRQSGLAGLGLSLLSQSLAEDVIVIRGPWVERDGLSRSGLTVCPALEIFVGFGDLEVCEVKFRIHRNSLPGVLDGLLGFLLPVVICAQIFVRPWRAKLLLLVQTSGSLFILYSFFVISQYFHGESQIGIGFHVRGIQVGCRFEFLLRERVNTSSVIDSPQ